MPSQDDEPSQAELFQEYRSSDQIKTFLNPVGPSFKDPLQEHVQQLLRLLAGSPDGVYAYASTVLNHAANKISDVLVVFPSLMPVLFTDLLTLTREASDLLKTLEDSKRGAASATENNQPDTEGRAHEGSRREHPLSVVLWDAVLPGYQSVSDAFGVMLIAANAAATPCVKNESSILIASSHFRRPLGQGAGVAKLGGNILQRVERILQIRTNLSDVHSALCELQDEFPAEEGIQELVYGMSHLLQMLPKFASGDAITAAQGDVRLQRLFTRANQQSAINVTALDKALYEEGSILQAQDDRNRRNEPMPIDLYRIFTPVDCSETTADLVDKYLSMELEYGSWGWAAGLEKIRQDSREFLAADCRSRIDTFLERELESGSPSVGGLIFLLVMVLNQEPEQVYDTPCGIECALTPDGKIRRSSQAIPISEALKSAPRDSVRHAKDTVDLELPSLARRFVEKLLGKCSFGDKIGAYLDMPREEFVQAFADKVDEIKQQEHIHELGIESVRYQFGRFAYTGCRSTVLVNALFGKDHYLPTNCAHYLWLGTDPLSDWFRDSGDAYFRGEKTAPVLDFDACASSREGIGASIPDLQHLRKFIRSKASKLKRKYGKRRQQRIKYFNELAHYVQFLFQCVTGCHENTDAFAYFSLRTSKNANFMTLSDKVSHYFDDGRLVFFEDVLRAWMEVYQAEISQLVPWIEKQGAHESAAYLRNLLGSIEYGTSPAIPYFIQIDEDAFTIQQLTCQVQRDWLGHEYLWNNVDEVRKVLGTFLFESGISQDLINLQMGHVIGGVHSFNDEAFWCVSEAFNAIAPSLKRLCREIGIKSPPRSMGQASLRVQAYDADLEPLWIFSEDKNRAERISSAESELVSIKEQLERLIAGQHKNAYRNVDIQAGLLQDISGRLSSLKKYNLTGWGNVVADLQCFVKKIDLKKQVRKVARIQKTSTLSANDFASQFDAALNMISSFHSSLDRKPEDDDEAENYELLVDLFLLQVSTGALVNFKLFELSLTQKFDGLKRDLWLAYWDVYPTESQLRPMRILLAPLAARVLELLKSRLNTEHIAEFDYDIGRLKRRIHVRLKSLGIEVESYKKAVQCFMDTITPYWRYKLPPQLLDYYRRPYSVTPAHSQNLYRMLHSGRVPPVNTLVVREQQEGRVLQPLTTICSPEELGCSPADHVAACISVVDGVIKKAGSLRLRDSSKIKEARRLLERSSTFNDAGISALHPTSHAAVFAIQSFLTCGILKKRIADSKYPSWSAITRYWDTIKTLAALQATLGVNVKDPQELSASIKAVIRNNGVSGKKKAARTRQTDSAALLNYAVACMDEGIIATVNPDVFESLGGDLLPSASGILTVYERDEMIRLVIDSKAFDDREKYRLLLYLMLHFEGLRDEEILETRPLDVLITLVDGEIRWVSVSTRFHDGYTPKNTQSNGRVCKNTSQLSETRRGAIQFLYEWLQDMQSKRGVDQIFYDGTTSGLEQSRGWLHAQVRVIARELLADPSFSGHQARHSVATEEGIESIIVNGNELSERFIENSVDIPVQHDASAPVPPNWISADPHKLQPVADKLRHKSKTSTWRYYFSAPDIALHSYLYHLTGIDIPSAYWHRLACGRHERNSTPKALVQKPYPSAVEPEAVNAREDRQKLPFFSPSEQISISLINRVLMAYAKGGRSTDVVVRSERVGEGAIRKIIDSAVSAEAVSAFCFYRLTGPAIFPEEYPELDSRFGNAERDFSRAAEQFEAFLDRASHEEIVSLNRRLRIWSQERAHTDKATRLQVFSTERLQAILSLLDQVGQNLGHVVVQHGNEGLVEMDDIVETVPLLKRVRTFMRCPRSSWLTRGGARQNVFVIVFTQDRASQFMSPYQLQRFLFVLCVRTSILLNCE